jgi:uncharacterized membrane protein
MILASINLPYYVLFHAIGLCAIGLYHVYIGTPRDAYAIRGITTFALAVAYLVTAYMPIEENQFIHASAPVRMAIGVLSAFAALTGRGDKKLLWGTALWDGLGGVLLGWQLGRYDGRVGSY